MSHAFFTSLLLVLLASARAVWALQIDEPPGLCELRIVINSNKMCKKPLKTFLKSLQAAEFQNWGDLLVVIGGADENKIYLAKNVTYLETTFMNFDLTGMAMLYQYRNHPLVRAASYLYLLDTSTVGVDFPNKLAELKPLGRDELRSFPAPASNLCDLSSWCQQQLVVDVSLVGDATKIHQEG